MLNIEISTEYNRYFQAMAAARFVCRRTRKYLSNHQRSTVSRSPHSARLCDAAVESSFACKTLFEIRFLLLRCYIQEAITFTVLSPRLYYCQRLTQGRVVCLRLRSKCPVDPQCYLVGCIRSL